MAPPRMPPPGGSFAINGTSPLPLPGATAPAAPPKPKPLPPTVQPGDKLRQIEAPEKISNPFERQAALLIQRAEDDARRLAESLSQRPSGAVEVNNETLHEMFHFSPFGTDAPSAFWREYDQLLATAQANGDPEPYAVAERGALDEVYPYRSRLALLDVLAPEERVKRAEYLTQISGRQTEKGNTPETMPSLVSPAGLPEVRSSFDNTPPPEQPTTPDNGVSHG